MSTTNATSRKRKIVVHDDDDEYDEIVPVTTSKRARTSQASHASAIVLMRRILADRENFNIPADEDETREVLVQLAEYAQELETKSAKQSKATTAAAPVAPVKTEEQIQAAAAKLCRVCVSQITKQMTWKPSCKTGSAKWAYEGICEDPAVFGAMFGLKGPPNFKMKKMSPEEFQNHIGSISASARYSSLAITSKEVNIRWSPDTKMFKFSGSYGDPYR